MKNIAILLSMVLLSTAMHAQKFWEQSNKSSLFDENKTYKVAILPVESEDMELQKEANLKKVSRQKLNVELTEVNNFQLIRLSKVDEVCNLYKFGGGKIDPSKYPNIAKTLGADVIVICTLSKEKTMFKKKEIGTVMAYIEIIDITTDAVLYTGKARAVNPISLQAEAEFAIQKALKKLKK